MKNWIVDVFIRARGMAVVLLLMAVPFGLLFCYVGMNVETAHLHRRLKSLSRQKVELARKNRALVQAIRDRKQAGRASAAQTERFTQNKIVRIRLSRAIDSTALSD